MIIQIIACPIELYARYRGEKGKDFTNRIVCLAVVEDDTDEREKPYREIVGVDLCDCEFSLATRSSNFVEYTTKSIPDEPAPSDKPQ